MRIELPANRFDLAPLARRLYGEVGEHFDALEGDARRLAIDAILVHVARSVGSSQDDLERHLGVEAYDAAVTEADRLNDLAGVDITNEYEEVKAIIAIAQMAAFVKDFMVTNTPEIARYTLQRYESIGEEIDAATDDEDETQAKVLSSVLHRLEGVEDFDELKAGMKVLVGAEQFGKALDELERYDRLETLGPGLCE